MSGATLTFNGFWDGLVSGVGLDVASSKTNVTQDEAFSNQLNILRDTTSGVSLDQELSDLIMYQRSYQACAKVITTASEMIDTVLGLIR
jgi:flagellar hook-associated protein 1 FlgK